MWYNDIMQCPKENHGEEKAVMDVVSIKPAMSKI